MKTLELNLQKKLLIVEVPNLKDYTIERISSDIYIVVGNEALKLNCKDVDFNLICRGTELWKDISNELVHKSLHTGLFAHYVKDIPVNTYCYRSSLISFISAIEAHGFCWGFNEILYEYRNIPNSPSFKKAESKTFHLETTLIFQIL